MKKFLVLIFVAYIFAGCGAVTVPTPVNSNTIVPNEECH